MCRFSCKYCSKTWAGKSGLHYHHNSGPCKGLKDATLASGEAGGAGSLERGTYSEAQRVRVGAAGAGGVVTPGCVDPFGLDFVGDEEEIAAVAADVGKDRARKVSAPISPVNRVAPVAPPVAPEAGAEGEWAWNWSDLKQAGWNLCGGDLSSDNFYLRPGAKKSTGVMGVTMFRDHASIEVYVRAHGFGGDGGDDGDGGDARR